MWQRTLLAVMIAFAAALAVATVWGNLVASPRGPADAERGDAAAAEAPPPIAVTTTPADRATDVSPAGPVTLRVEHGHVGSVSLVAADGAPAPGAPSRDGTGWSASAPLAYATTYTWRGTVVDEAGRSSPVAGSFRTIEPKRTTSANLNIADDATVGVGAPIVVQFDGPVADKAAAERALEVRTSRPTTGSWAWLPDTADGARAHWRPKDYWAPGTVVDVAVKLPGVDLGGGAWGGETVTTHFTIGRSQIVKADVNSFRMVVVRDGAPVMSVPASYGLGSDPNRNTTNGTHVVMSKQEFKLMTNPAYGYVNLPQRWAVRISNNGEFIHANPSSADAQGNENVTHGCVNLSTPDAQAYFATAMFGDPVEVSGSPVPMPRTDIYDWSLSWEEWRSLSAVA